MKTPSEPSRATTPQNRPLTGRSETSTIAAVSPTKTFGANFTVEELSGAGAQWNQSRYIPKKTRLRVAELKSRPRDSIFALDEMDPVGVESVFQTANNLIVTSPTLNRTMVKGRPVTFWLVQTARDEEKKRTKVAEAQLEARDQLFVEMLVAEDRLKKNNRQEAALIANAEIRRRQQLEGERNLRRVLKSEEDTDRLVIQKVEDRAFLEIIALDRQLRQRMLTLGRLDAKRKAREHSHTVWQENPEVMEEERKQQLAAKLHRAEQTIVDNGHMMDDDDDPEEVVESFNYDVAAASPRKKRGEANARRQLDRINELRRRLHDKTASAEPSEIDGNDREGGASSIAADDARDDEDDEYPLGHATPRNELNHSRTSDGSALLETPRHDNDSFTLVPTSRLRPVLLLQRVGRGYLLREGSAAVPEVHADAKQIPQLMSPSSMLSPTSAGMNSGRQQPSMLQMDSMIFGALQSAGSITLTARDQFEAPDGNMDVLLKKVKRRRLKALPKSTMPQMYLDVASPVKKREKQQKQQQQQLQQSTDESGPRGVKFVAPLGSTPAKIYDAKVSSDNQKELKEARVRRQAAMRNEAWNVDDKIRKAEIKAVADHKSLVQKMTVQRHALMMRRYRESDNNKKMEKRKEYYEHREKLIAYDDKEIERLELHIELRQKFMKENRTIALQQSLLEVPGSDRIAGLTSDFSYKSVNKSELDRAKQRSMHTPSPSRGSVTPSPTHSKTSFRDP